MFLREKGSAFPTQRRCCRCICSGQTAVPFRKESLIFFVESINSSLSRFVPAFGGSIAVFLPRIPQGESHSTLTLQAWALQSISTGTEQGQHSLPGAPRGNYQFYKGKRALGGIRGLRYVGFDFSHIHSFSSPTGSLTKEHI